MKSFSSRLPSTHAVPLAKTGLQAVSGAGGGTDPTGPLPSPQRERILDATERLIAAHGCAGTSIEAIVKEAGVSSVTFYEFFDGKEECFVAAFDRAVERWGAGPDGGGDRRGRRGRRALLAGAGRDRAARD